MLRIRLLRAGKKNQPFFKVVVTDQKNPPRGGRPKEKVGFYNPLTKERKLNKERILYWLSVGAKPSDTVLNLMISEGIVEGKKVDVFKKPKKEKEKEKPVEEKSAVEKPAEKLAEEKKQEEKPADEKPAEEKPAKEKAEGKPAEELAREKPAEKPAEELVEEKSAEELVEEKIEEKPAEEKPETA